MMISSLLQAIVVSSVPLFLSGILPTASGEKANQLFRLPFSLDLGLGVQRFAFLMFAIVVLSSVLTLATIYYCNRLALSRIPVVSVRLLASYLDREYEWRADKNNADLVKRVVGDTGVVVTQVIQHLIQITARGFDIAVIFGVLFWAKPSVALTAFCGLAAVYCVLVFLVRKHVRRAGKRLHEANSQLFVMAKEALETALEARLLGRRDYFLKRFDGVSKRASKEMLSIAYIGVLPKPLLELCLFGGIFLGVAGLTARGWNASAIVPLLSLYGAAGIRLLPAAQQMYFSVNNVLAFQAMVQDLARDLEWKADVSQRKQLSQNASSRDLFDLKNVGFRYQTSTSNVLEDVTFKIVEGQKVAFVGHTGSGKSTLMNLLLGFLEPTFGELRVAGSGISLGYVPQKIAFVDGTIAENIALGVPEGEVDFKRLEEVCKRAQAWEFISKLDGGLGHEFGEDATRLSGGQRQRIGIARALYHKPRVIVLDEASSALDAQTEKEVYAPLFGDEQLTVVVISHRLAVLEGCDRILMLKEGKVVGTGSFSELKANCGEFKAMLEAGEVGDR